MLHYKYCDAVKRLTKGITHEYNNIFTGLSGQTNLLMQESESSNTSPKRKELIQNLLQRGIEQTDILFDFSRETDNTKRLISPVRLAQKAIDLLNAVSRLHYFEMEAESDLPKIYSSHRDTLLMLFYLGENAIESMKDGGSIALELSHGDEHEGVEYVSFSMKDSGGGFPEKIKNTAFKPFTTTKESSAARGLGLYAVQVIVLDHNGRVGFQQRAESGTEVTVDLPVHQHSSQKEGKSITSTETVAIQSSPRPPKKYVFLIVDDEEAMRDMLLNRLQRSGHVAFCVATCAEAIEEFGYLADTISAILLDISLRETNGYECAKKLRAINENIRIIFMSGQDVDGQGNMCNNAVFLRKPFKIDQLERMVGDV